MPKNYLRSGLIITISTGMVINSISRKVFTNSFLVLYEVYCAWYETDSFIKSKILCYWSIIIYICLFTYLVTTTTTTMRLIEKYPLFLYINNFFTTFTKGIYISNILSIHQLKIGIIKIYFNNYYLGQNSNHSKNSIPSIATRRPCSCSLLAWNEELLASCKFIPPRKKLVNKKCKQTHK